MVDDIYHYNKDFIEQSFRFIGIKPALIKDGNGHPLPKHEIFLRTTGTFQDRLKDALIVGPEDQEFRNLVAALYGYDVYGLYVRSTVEILQRLADEDDKARMEVATTPCDGSNQNKYRKAIDAIGEGLKETLRMFYARPGALGTYKTFLNGIEKTSPELFHNFGEEEAIRFELMTRWSQYPARFDDYLKLVAGLFKGNERALSGVDPQFLEFALAAVDDDELFIFEAGTISRTQDRGKTFFSMLSETFAGSPEHMAVLEARRTFEVKPSAKFNNARRPLPLHGRGRLLFSAP